MRPFRSLRWLVVVVVVVVVGVGVVLLAGRSAHHQEQDAAKVQWRAGSDTLVQRVEQLAGAGEVDAAASVLEVLLKRGDVADTGSGDRARMAVARGYLTAGRRDQALAQVQAIPWADKGPAIAADIVGLELAVRWRGLFDDHGELVSGALTPRNSLDAPFGRTEGLWQDRWEQYRALATSLDRGARMVSAEGGHVTMPASAALLRMARYSRGDGTLATLMTALGDPQRWDADLALALVRLQVNEHDPDAAMVAAEVLWSRHATTPQAGLALRDLRIWQGRRNILGKTVKLWDFPGIDARLDAMALIYPALATSAEVALRQERELNQTAMETSITRTISADVVREVGVTGDLRSLPTEPVMASDDEQPREWRLALDYDGLDLQIDQREVAAGLSARLTVTSEHRGEHRLRVHRLADRAAWDALCARPSRALLPESVAAEVTFDLGDWSTIGTTQSHPLSIPDLTEGFYAVTLSARACPVVVLSGLTVVDPDLHLIAGRSEVLAWVVRRVNGQGKVGTQVVANVSLVRNTEQAAGNAWADADPAWRSGFIEGFTGTPSPDFRRADQQAIFAQGVAVGAIAAQQDPALSVDLTGTSDAGGLLRFALPVRLQGRAYQVNARISSSAVEIARTAAYGADAAWTSKAVAWADKPLVRPGETVRFKALLRDFNGDGYRLPVGELSVSVLLGNSVLSDTTLALSDHGTVSGEVLVPPGAVNGDLRVKLGEGSPLQIARVERVRLPDVRYEISGLDSVLRVRAGESVPLNVRLRDRGGEPLAGISVHCDLRALVEGIAVPTGEVVNLITDLAGEARFSIPTSASNEADYQATVSFRYEQATYQAAHAWRTHTFPFQLDAVVRNRDLRVGGVVQAELRLPSDAEVAVQLMSSGKPRGPALTVRGRWPAWTQVALPLTEEHLGCDHLTISASVLGGGSAKRVLKLSVQERQIADGNAKVVAMPVRNRVETGEVLPLALGVSDPGRDVLVLGGARDVVLAQVERLEQSSKQTDLTVASAWAPNVFVSAVAYLPERGFVTSERREVEVLPIDRLLKVSIMPTRTDLRPGEVAEAVVEVTDWRGQPAPGCALSLGVVDEVLYQLTEDPTPDLWQYFHTYRRTWGLIEGVAAPMRFPQATLWRSVISRWQTSGSMSMFGSRMGGGKRLALSKGGGAMGIDYVRALLRPEADGTIHWVADLRTDAQGRALVRFPLPPNAGRFRCTARANDASAAVVVGEVRSVISSREPYACALDVPDVVAAGDVVPAQIQVANHEDHEQTLVLTLPDGSTRDVVLAARARRTLSVPVTIPQRGATPGDILRVGDLLGERLDMSVAVTTKEPGARVVRTTATTSRRLPGHPTAMHLRLVAPADGRMRLPETIHPGAGVWLRLRAWPDAAARRAGELADWRQGTNGSARQAMGWLLAEPGAERRAKLAELWPKLGDDPASVVVKQAAIRRGEAVSGITAVADDAIGDWLLARGRAAGQTLPSPRRRGLGSDLLSARVAIAATALAEGWSEGMTRWTAVRDELLRTTEVNPLALGIACDAARLAGEVAVGKQLAAQLAQSDWSVDLVAVLAAEVLPEQSEVALSPMTIRTGDQDIVVPANEFAEWSGVVSDALELRAGAGAVVDLDLIIQQPLPRSADVGVRLALWQESADGFEQVADNSPIWPGRRLLLVIEPGTTEADLTIALPSLLRRIRQEGEVFLIDSWDDHWPLGWGDSEVLVNDIVGVPRADVLANLTTALERMELQRTPLGRRVAVEHDDDVRTIHGGELLHLQSQPGKTTVFALSVSGEGSCRWPGLRIDDTQQDDRTLVVAADVNAQTPNPAVGHPLRAAIRATAARCTDAELVWLLDGALRSTVADWQHGLRTLDPLADQTLDELVSHPGHETPGHWTHAKIRRWVDGEPLLHADAVRLREVIGSDEPTLATLVRLAETSRDLRRLAWSALPQPQTVPAASLVTLHRWYERLAQVGLITSRDYRAWCWRQDLDGDLLTRLGYANSIDAWVAFVRSQLDLPLRIGAGVRTGSAVGVWVTIPGDNTTGQVVRREPILSPGFGGTNLGISGLGDDLVVVALADTYELRPFLPSPQPQPAVISLDYTDVPAAEVFDHLNLLLANRGQAAVRLGSSITRDELGDLPPVTVRIADIATKQAVEWFAKLVGLKLVRDRQGLVLEREQ
jgi:GNAT superfamily N-acetyltransferase